MNRITIQGYKKEAAKTRFIDGVEALSEDIWLNGASQLFLMSFEPGEIRQAHKHDEIRVTFIRGGKAKFVIDGMEKTAEAGDIIMILPTTEHNLEVIGGERLLLAELVVLQG